MLTPLGWWVAVASAVLYAAAVALGYPELAVLATAGALAVLLGLGWTMTSPALRLHREIAPTRVARGDPAVAVVTVTNEGRRARSRLSAMDACGDRTVEVALPRLPPGVGRTVSYRLPTERRGEVRVGPLCVVRNDPLAMSRRIHGYGGSETLLVWPKVYPIPLLSSGRARELEGSTSDTSPVGTVTFHALREYARGDDLRHIHWRTTARTGALMIKQLVDASLPETTIVLDVRPHVYLGTGTDSPFEVAVDSAASVSMAAARGGFSVRLLTSAGHLSRTSDGGALLDRLALVQPDPSGALGTTLEHLRRSRAGGLLAVVTGEPDPEEYASVAATAPRFDRVVLLRIGRSATSPPTLAGVTCIDLATPEALSSAWLRETHR